MRGNPNPGLNQRLSCGLCIVVGVVRTVKQETCCSAFPSFRRGCRPSKKGPPTILYAVAETSGVLLGACPTVTAAGTTSPMKFGSAAEVGSIAGAGSASFTGVSSVAGSAASSTFGGVVASFFLASLLLPALLALRKSPVSLFVFTSPSPSDFSFLTLPVKLPKMEPRFDLRVVVGVVAGASSLGASSAVSFGDSAAGVSVASAGLSIFGASAGVSVAGSSFAGTGGTISASFFSVVGLLSFEARLPKMEPRLVGFGAAFGVSAASAAGSVVSAVSAVSAGFTSSLGPSKAGTGAAATAAAVKCYQLLQLNGIHRDLLASSVASAEGSVPAAGAAASSSFFSSAFSSFFPRRLPKMLPRLRERDRLLLLDFFFPSTSSLLLDPVRAGAVDSVGLTSVLFLEVDPSLATDAPATASAAGLP